jgi:hypothetical protein
MVNENEDKQMYLCNVHDNLHAQGHIIAYILLGPGPSFSRSTRGKCGHTHLVFGLLSPCAAMATCRHYFLVFLALGPMCDLKHSPALTSDMRYT